MLTFVQEAALNAAGEAMSDLKDQTKDFFFYLGVSQYASEPEKKFQAFISGSSSVWGHGATAAEAVADLYAKWIEEKTAPPKLKTAAEAVAAAKEIVRDYPELILAIDDLPLA